jgi:hypothetical protein
MNRKQALAIVESIDSLATIKRHLYDCINRNPDKVSKRNTWQYHAIRMVLWIENGMSDETPFSIFSAKGNKKLPFYAFSSLAIADCPGRGACVSFCYSLKAWRYPAAFFRQLQNSLLIRYRRETITNAFQSIPENKTVRLFVDGDFQTVDSLHYFMNLCKTRPDLSVYGYSKSWHEFVTLDQTGFDWPENYLTNASSGSRWQNTGIANAFLALPVVRGSFDAVLVDAEFIRLRSYQGKDKPRSIDYRKAVSNRLRETKVKTFPCPGNCGDCLPRGRHACGDRAFADVSIGIGVH